MTKADALHETLRRTLEERGYRLWSHEYADHYDLVTDAGKIRVVLWHPSQGSRCDVSLFRNDAYGAEHAGFAKVKFDPRGSERASFLVAVIGAAEAELGADLEGSDAPLTADEIAHEARVNARRG